MASKKISMRLPEELLERMDLISSLEHMDRTELTKQAVRDFIDKTQRKREFKQHVVERYLAGALAFEKLERILGKEDALALKASKALMEQGDTLAKKLA